MIIGTQWGDEGKGKIVDYYGENVDAVARFQGGNNAGHTVIVGDKKYALHFIPSGVIRGKKCVMGNGMVIEPRGLIKELETLREAGIETDLLIDWKAHVITQEELDEDAKDTKIGTTKKGIGPCYKHKIERTGIRIIDLLDKNKVSEEYYKAGQQLKKYIGDASLELSKLNNVLVEGAQGTMLDIDHGTYPFVTSSNTTVGGACSGLGIGPTNFERIVGITKAYTTRVGNGPFPTELQNKNGEKLAQQGNEFGTTTGRPRRCGWFDAVIVKYSARVNGLTEIALTKLDVLDGFDKVKLCVAYEKNGERVEDMPANIAECEPVYIEMQGWESSRVNSYEQLPTTAKDYIAKLEELVGVKVKLISVGPARDETFLKD